MTDIFSIDIIKTQSFTLNDDRVVQIHQVYCQTSEGVVWFCGVRYSSKHLLQVVLTLCEGEREEEKEGGRGEEKEGERVGERVMAVGRKREGGRNEGYIGEGVLEEDGKKRKEGEVQDTLISQIF